METKSITFDEGDTYTYMYHCHKCGTYHELTKIEFGSVQLNPGRVAVSVTEADASKLIDCPMTVTVTKTIERQ